MEKAMRRFRQQLSADECTAILHSATSGVLSLCGADMQPYGVPLSHVYYSGKLYFHSAVNGHKLELIKENSNVSFTIISKDEIHPEKYTTYFKSVIAFGKIRVVEDEEEKLGILEILGRRCNPHDRDSLANEIAKGARNCVALEMSIDRISGKQAIELVK